MYSLTAVAFITVVVSSLLLECTRTCQKEERSDYVNGDCPVKLSSVPPQYSDGTYLETVGVNVWMKNWGSCKTCRLDIFYPFSAFKPIRIRPEKNKRCDNEGETGVEYVWKQVYSLKAEAGKSVSVSYITPSINCSVSYSVKDPVPNFELSVNESSKSINVTVEPGHKVNARWCFSKDKMLCSGPPKIVIDPCQSQSALLNIPYILPCVCVEVYYRHISDAERSRKCPFQNKSLADAGDVWQSSKLTVYKSSLEWGSQCPASDLQISASLCWRQHEHLCTPVFNLTSLETEGMNLKYNISAVDKHPQMCVQLSLQGSHNTSCPFQPDESSWEVHIGPGRQSVLLHITSSVQATYSAQLCILNEKGCSSLGKVHSVTVEGYSSETNVPLHFLADKPCVQVWRSHPALSGRRILCPDCWLSIQKPVLLVCSSEHSAHVSSVCALASILQRDLSATVHMALWAQSSQTQAGSGSGTGVTDLGPLPWLYGQWENVLKAQGKVLIIWSPGAKKTYETWREKKANVGKNEGKKGAVVKLFQEDCKPNGRRQGKSKIEKAIAEKDCVNLCDDVDCNSPKESSSVIMPVFLAALARLEGVLQGNKGQGVALVYFQGLCRNRDIPKALKEIPHYCLPSDFRGLIQVLGGIRQQTKTGKFRWHCWPRLLSKVLSVWLARRLAKRLQTLLPQTRGKKLQGLSVTSSLKMNSGKTQSGLRLPLAANTARQGSVQEHEPLNVSPWGAETL
ncbi:uncharacterized protein LOC121517064 isoform X2 [Cheilinus undulatus]|uniref:uncharacterized protein LOC121517064 isoform X2 n=1 Tax=Cheilinus undulatus TaxID=241271 RepID=UPI001BD4EDB2|nr:uncharacterized protein LOC121517064 isoform X2 [Cheilinus undulatus]